MEDNISDCFKVNFKCLQIFGIWPGKLNNIYYKCYSYIFVIINVLIYNILLLLNLLYIPWELHLLIRDVVFIFTEVTVIAKVLMILIMRSKILQAFSILDSPDFKGKNIISRKIVQEHICIYRRCWKINTYLSYISYLSQLLPFFGYLIYNIKIDLPISMYCFLNENFKIKYFIICYVYQSFGIHAHMHYNFNIDSLMAGFIYMTIGQVKVLNLQLQNLGVIKTNDTVVLENQINYNLLECINHYQKILK